jgi:hypothetical protein
VGAALRLDRVVRLPERPRLAEKARAKKTKCFFYLLVALVGKLMFYLRLKLETKSVTPDTTFRFNSKDRTQRFLSSARGCAFVRSARERSDMGRGPLESVQFFSYTVWFSVFWFFLVFFFFVFLSGFSGFCCFLNLFQILKIV